MRQDLGARRISVRSWPTRFDNAAKRGNDRQIGPQPPGRLQVDHRT